MSIPETNTPLEFQITPDMSAELVEAMRAWNDRIREIRETMLKMHTEHPTVQ